MAMKKKQTEEVNVIRIDTERITVPIVGTSPLILNRLSEKAQRELILPGQRKTSGQKATTLKHDPYQEFQDAPYISADPDSPTLLLMPSTAFKSALRSVAIDLPESSSKAALGRLTFVENEYVPIYGIPQLHMSVVRQAGINRTPDVRTRCIVPEWCALVSIVFTKPILNRDSIINLMAAAGVIRGVGDWRPEKGSGNYGQWRLSDPSEKDFKRIAKMDREFQIKAMNSPACYDNETQELLSWFDAEVERRGFSTMKDSLLAEIEA